MNLQRNPTERHSSWDWRAAISAGRLAQDSGDLARAETRFREAVRLARSSDSSTGLLEALNALGVALANLGRLSEAEAAFREVVAQTPPKGNLSTGLSNLAQVLSAMGRIDEAQALLETLLQDAESDPLGRAAVLNNLAVIETGRENYVEAEALLRAALDASRSVLGPQHPHAVALLANLGMLLRNAGKEAEARATLEQAYRASETALGPDDPQTQTLRAALGAG